MAECCDRTLPHETPAGCWTSGWGPRLSAFVDLDVAEREPRGDWNHDADAPLEFPGVQTIAHTIAISDVLALDFNLLEPGTPAYEAAVARQDEARARHDAWKRSWPGRRARLRAAVRSRVHAVRHAVAARLDADCMARADDA